MNKIPTAEEFIRDYLDASTEFMESLKEQMSNMQGFNFYNITDLMVKFAKLHVKECKKVASKEALLEFHKGNSMSVDKKFEDNGGRHVYMVDKISILQAYPEFLIREN